jgi:hypothetical protein
MSPDKIRLPIAFIKPLKGTADPCACTPTTCCCKAQIIAKKKTKKQAKKIK